MRLLYSKLKANSHLFAIYHPYYKEKSGMIKSAHDYHIIFYLTSLIREIF